MKSLFGIMILCLIILACGGSESVSRNQSSAPQNSAWYEGGTLHKSTVAEWNSASNANRLATAADWVTVLAGWDTLDEARIMATDLRECVNESAEVSPPEMKANELGVACAILMGWELKE